MQLFFAGWRAVEDHRIIHYLRRFIGPHRVTMLPPWLGNALYMRTRVAAFMPQVRNLDARRLALLRRDHSQTQAIERDSLETVAHIDMTRARRQ